MEKRRDIDYERERNETTATSRACWMAHRTDCIHAWWCWDRLVTTHDFTGLGIALGLKNTLAFELWALKAWLGAIDDDGLPFFLCACACTTCVAYMDGVNVSVLFSGVGVFCSVLLCVVLCCVVLCLFGLGCAS
jgi:hypothetical protein